MRLVDADELLKHASDHETISTHLIWNAPTVDAVPVIRCKNCKWFRTFYHGETMPFSYECAKLWLTGIGVDDFCSKAERKDDGHLRNM